MSEVEKTDYEKALEKGFPVLNSPDSDVSVDAQVESDAAANDGKKPEGDQPVVKEETPIVKADEKTQIDFEKVTGGKFKTQDEFENFHKESLSYKEKVAALEAELKSAKEAVSPDPYEDNPEMARMVAISKKTGIKDVAILNKLTSLDLEKIDPKTEEPNKLLDIIKLQQVISDDFVSDRSLSKKYFIEKPEDFDDLSDKEKEDYNLEVEERTALLRKDAKAAIKELKEKGSVELPKRQTEEDRAKAEVAKRDEFVNAWMPKMPEIGASLETFSTKVTVPDIGEIEFSIDLKDEQEKSIQQVIHELAGLLYHQDKKPTAEETSAAISIAKDRLFLLNKDRILSKIVEEAIATGAEGYRNKVHNPSAKKPGDKAPETQLSDYDKRKAEGKL